MDREHREKVAAMRARLPGPQIGKWGPLQVRYGKGVRTFTLAKGESQALRVGDFGAEK